MKANRVYYRTLQFWQALSRRPTQDELAEVRRRLGERRYALFLKMQPSEQVHSLQVMRRVLFQGAPHPDLITAALLHDVGKSRYPLHLWERVLIVLARAIIPGCADRWGEGHPAGWRKPFVVAHHHASWGAEMAEKAGASALTVALIRRHQEPLPQEPVATLGEGLEDRLLECLKSCDEES